MIQFSKTKTQHSFTMIYFSGLVVCLLMLTAEARVGKSSLSICADADECFLYDVICSTADYEVRDYEAVKAAVTTVIASSLEDALSKASPLFLGYLQGGNDKGVNMGKVVPLLVTVPQKTGQQTENYIMKLILPEVYQKNPPKPTNRSIFIRDTAGVTSYVGMYIGWATDSNDQAARDSLSSKLDAAGANYLSDFHITGVYNRPNPKGNMQNELAFVVEGDPVC